MCMHLVNKELTFKQLLDFGLFLVNDYHVHIKSVRDVLLESKMTKAWDTFVFLCSEIFDIELSNLYFEEPNLGLIYKVKEEIIYYESNNDYTHSIVSRIWFKTKRIFSRQWIFKEKLLPDNYFYDIILGSVKEHLFRPSQI